VEQDDGFLMTIFPALTVFPWSFLPIHGCFTPGHFDTWWTALDGLPPGQFAPGQFPSGWSTTLQWTIINPI